MITEDIEARLHRCSLYSLRTQIQQAHTPPQFPCKWAAILILHRTGLIKKNKKKNKKWRVWGRGNFPIILGLPYKVELESSFAIRESFSQHAQSRTPTLLAVKKPMEDEWFETNGHCHLLCQAGSCLWVFFRVIPCWNASSQRNS